MWLFWPEILFSSFGYKLPSGVFVFQLKGCSFAFLVGRAVCWALPSHFSCVWLCDTVDCSPQAPLSMGFSRQEILEWVAMPSSRGSSQRRDQTFKSVSSTFQVNSLLLSHQGSPGQVYRAVTMINSPSFCLSGSIFTSSFLEGTFTRYVLCGSQIFFLKQFTYVMPLPLWLLMRNWALVSLKNPLSLSHHFCLAAV